MPAPDPVNTSTSPPLTAGQWNTDGPNSNWYCDVSDVASRCFGVDWTELGNYIASGIVPGLGYDTVEAWIAGKLIPDAESLAESIMRRVMRPTQITRALDGTGKPELFLPASKTPVISVDSCVITIIPAAEFFEFKNIRYSDSLGELSTSYWQSSDLIVDSATGRLVIPPRVQFMNQSLSPNWNYTFLQGKANIQVTWTYGFASKSDVPRDVCEAVSKLAAIPILVAEGQRTMSGMSESRFNNTAKLAGRNINLPYKDLIERFEKEANAALRRKRSFTA